MQTKKCSKCGEVKAVSEFYKDKYSKDGVRSSCKECKKQYYKANNEKILGQKKQHYKANKKKIKKYNKQYQQANKEKIKEHRKQYYQANKEQIKEYNKQYYQANNEQIIEQKKQYDQDNINKLGDTYIKDIIRKQTNGMLKASDMPEELIELKRNNIILKRKIKDNAK